MFLYLLFLIAGLASGQDNSTNSTVTNEMMVRLENRIEEIERKLNASETEQQERTIAFFANKDSNEIYGANQTIVFENNVTNTGKAYDPKSGIFKAPIAGVYAFFMTVSAMDNYNVVSYFDENGKIVANCSGTGTVILQLDESDTISVKNERERGYVQGQGYSSFSGHKV